MKQWNLRGLQQSAKEQMPRQRGIPKKRASVTELRQEIAELRQAGAQMSNVCFNWSQSTATITADDRAMLRRLYEEWDAVKRR